MFSEGFLVDRDTLCMQAGKDESEERLEGLQELRAGQQNLEEVVTVSNLTAAECLQCLLVPDHLQSVCRFLRLPDVASLALACRISATSVNSHNELWAQLCVDWMGVKAPLQNETTTTIGLAQKEIDWKQFLKLSLCSVVLTWGKGTNGRTGHSAASPAFDELTGDVPRPAYCTALSRRGVDFIGKTAEVGSVALARGGKAVYLWGLNADSTIPLEMEATAMSPISGDVVVDASCHHNPGCMLVFASGLVLLKNRRSRTDPSLEDSISVTATLPANCSAARVRSPYGSGYFPEAADDQQGEPPSTTITFEPLSVQVNMTALRDNEQPVQGLGSQAGFAGVLTNQDRVLWWQDWYQRSNDLIEPQIIEPINPVDGRTFKIKSVAFGHQVWLALDDSGLLFEHNLNQRSEGDRQWSLVKLDWQLPEFAGRHVVGFDCGTSHQGFVLDDGRAFTWGNNRYGMLGHGTTKEHDVAQPPGALLYGTTEEHDVDQPREVSFFVQQRLKVVAIGCGGHVSWTGGFTLFLCDDNTLWQSGKLTEMT